MNNGCGNKPIINFKVETMKRITMKEVDTYVCKCGNNIDGQGFEPLGGMNECVFECNVCGELVEVVDFEDGDNE